jgi:hypothetical protein
MNTNQVPKANEPVPATKADGKTPPGVPAATMAQPEKETALMALELEGRHLVLRIDWSIIVLGVIVLGICIFMQRRRCWGVKSDLKSVVLKFGGLPEATIEVNRDTQKIAFAAYTELVTRKIALPFDEKHDVITDVYKSWYQMFTTTRELIKQVPAHHIARSHDTRELVQSLIDLLNQGLRPHLTKWQARFRHWYEREINKPESEGLSPQEIQRKFPDYDALITDIKGVNSNFQEYARQLRSLAEARKIVARTPDQL